MSDIIVTAPATQAAANTPEAPAFERVDTAQIRQIVMGPDTNPVALAAHNADLWRASHVAQLVEQAHARAAAEAGGFDEVFATATETTYYLQGLRHREDGPAYISAQGDEQWYLNGIRHRADGPAIITRNGAEVWYRGGQLMPRPTV